MTQLAKSAANGAEASRTGDGGIDDLTVSGTGRFIRMNGTQRALTGVGYSLWEFQVFGTLP